MTALDIARANRIQRSEQQQIVNKANPMAGYTVVYKAVTECTALSDGAYRTYMVLLGYDYHNGRAIFPGLDTLAAQRGVARRTIQGHITELKAAGLLIVERRGLNLTNEYELPDASAWTPDALVEWQKSAHPQKDERSGSILHIQSGKNLHIQSGKNLPPNKEQIKKEQIKKEEGVVAATPPRASASATIVSTEHDHDATEGRILALALAREVFGSKTSTEKTLARYEAFMLSLLDRGHDWDDLWSWMFWMDSGRHYWRGKSRIFSEEQMLKDLTDWEADGKPEPIPDSALVPYYHGRRLDTASVASRQAAGTAHEIEWRVR